MKRFRRALLTIAIFPLSLTLGCGDDEPEPETCAPEIGTATAADISIDARAVASGDSVAILVTIGRTGDASLNYGYVRLTEGQTLRVYDADDVDPNPTAINQAAELTLTESAESDCGPYSYVASGSTSSFDGKVVLQFTEGTQTESRHPVHVTPTTVTTAPTEVTVGTQFDVVVSRHLPSIAGFGIYQDWWIELRGDCIIPQTGSDFAFTEDADQFGSDQRPIEDMTMHVTVPSSVFNSEVGACAVDATLVVSVNTTDCSHDCVSTNAFGQYQDSFTFNLSP